MSKSSKLILQWFVTVLVTRKFATPSHRSGWDDSCCLEQALSRGVEGNPTQCMERRTRPVSRCQWLPATECTKLFNFLVKCKKFWYIRKYNAKITEGKLEIQVVPFVCWYLLFSYAKLKYFLWKLHSLILLIGLVFTVGCCEYSS